MIRFVFCWVFLLGVLLSWAPVSAQQDDVVDFIEKDSTAFIVISDPAPILEFLQSSELFQNRNYLRALELLVDQEYALTTDNQLVELENRWFELCDCLAQMSEVSIIVHSWKDGNTPDFSVILKGSDENNNLFAEQLRLAKAQYESPDEIPEGESAADFLTTIGGEATRELTIRRSADFVLVSNARKKADELIKRIEQSDNKKFRSLAKNRSYLRVQSQLGQRSSALIHVRGYINPENFGDSLATKILPDLSGPLPQTLSGAGFQVSINDDPESLETAGETYIPILNWDFVIAYTAPAKAYGKVIESFAPLEDLPLLPHTITRLEADTYQPETRYQARKEIFAQRSEEEQEWYPALIDLIGPMGILKSDQQTTDAEAFAAMSRGGIQVFFDPTPHKYIPKLLIERVNDRPAVERFLLKLIEQRNENRPESTHIQEIENNFGTLYGRSESAIRELCFGESPQRHKQALDNSILAQFQQYYLDDDWLVIANRLDMKRFLETHYGDQEHEPQVFDAIFERAQKVSGYDSHFKVSFNSFKEFLHSTSVTEMSRLLDKYPARDELREFLQAPTDDYGMRLKIESAADAETAVRVLLERALVETFGTSISLSSRENQKMMTFGQIYSFRNGSAE